MSENIFQKILSNSATEAEKIDFFSSLKNNSKEREDFYRYKNHYVVSQFNPELYAGKQSRNFPLFWSQIQSQKQPKRISQWLRYAAIFLVAALLGFSADYILMGEGSKMASQHIEYNSEKGSVSKIRLEDGSFIWLSSGTKLTIDKNQQGETTARLNGEAFFDLIPNVNRKFIVDLDHFKVKDVGTRFNIRAYESEPNISTILEEGRIDLVKQSGLPLLSVKPGELVNFHKSNRQIVVSEQDPSIITAWKDGKFVFIDKPLSEICKELENWYNVEIRIEDAQLAKTRYTSVVKRSTTVKMVLQILAITDKICIEISDKQEGKDLIRIKK